MKRVLVAAALLSTCLSTNALAEVVFRGTIVWTLAKDCEFERKDFDYTSLYHPRGAGNEDFTGISHITQFGGAAYHLGGADFTSAFQPVEGVATGWSWYTYDAEILVTQRVPPTIATTTKFVTLRGKIKSPWSDPGVGGNPCVVTLRRLIDGRIAMTPLSLSIHGGAN